MRQRHWFENRLLTADWMRHLSIKVQEEQQSSGRKFRDGIKVAQFKFNVFPYYGIKNMHEHLQHCTLYYITFESEYKKIVNANARVFLMVLR